MTLHTPFQISARLLPALRIADAYISLEYAGQNAEGRTIYRYFIDTPKFEHEAADLKSGCSGGTLQEGFASLLSFLGAAAESYQYGGQGGENSDLFPLNVVKWAYQHSDELAGLRFEIEETEQELINEN